MAAVTITRTERFEIVVTIKSNNSNATVRIGTDQANPTFPAMMVMAEHLMTMVALDPRSGVDFEERLKLLCDGARSNRGKIVGIPEN